MNPADRVHLLHGQTVRALLAVAEQDLRNECTRVGVVNDAVLQTVKPVALPQDLFGDEAPGPSVQYSCSKAVDAVGSHERYEVDGWGAS